MKREEKIENILNSLLQKGSKISYLDNLKQNALDITKKILVYKKY